MKESVKLTKQVLKDCGVIKYNDNFICSRFFVVSKKIVINLDDVMKTCESYDRNLHHLFEEPKNKLTYTKTRNLVEINNNGFGYFLVREFEFNQVEKVYINEKWVKFFELEQVEGNNGVESPLFSLNRLVAVMPVRIN